MKNGHVRGSIKTDLIECQQGKGRSRPSSVLKADRNAIESEEAM